MQETAVTLHLWQISDHLHIFLKEKKKKKPDLDSSWISYPLPNLNLKPVSAADILH